MEVYSYRQMARDKASRIKDGMCAYAETEMMAHLIKKNYSIKISKPMKIQLTSAAGLSLYPSNPFLKAQKRGDLKPLSR